MVETMKLGFIGTGNMASAIMGGIIRNEVIPAKEIIGADLFAPGRERVKSQFGIHVTDSNKEVAQKAEVIILSVKPQFYADVIQDIKDEIKDNQIIITIAPGKTLSWLEEQFGKQVKIVRTMPNTPAMVGEGMTAACPNPYLNEEEIAYVKTLLQSFSRVEIVPERRLGKCKQPTLAAVLIDGQNKTRYTMAFARTCSRPENRHSGRWNILLADGHVQASRELTWEGVFTNSGSTVSTNSEACAMYNFQIPGISGDPVWPK